MKDGNRVFTESQENLLNDVINRIVPAEQEFPGAGDLGVTSYIDNVVAESGEMKNLFLAGLAQIEITAATNLGKEFGSLSLDEKDRVLAQVEQERSDFFNALVQHTYNGYYTNPTILPLIGHSGRPPQPLGYPMEPFDQKLLENVRKREPLYRRV